MGHTVERVLAARGGEGCGGERVNEHLTFRRTLVVFVGLQLGQVMSSIDGTIVATALPTIAGDLGGFSRSTWVVTAYALAMVASMPIYGKLGDLYGRRRVLLAAIGIFLAGSLACGAAQTMDQLLVARFLQGLGGGGLGAVAMATVADIVPARQLGRWLGYQGVIYAVASAVGPLVGGLFVEHLSWRWAFLVNLPIGLLAADDRVDPTPPPVPTRSPRHRLVGLDPADERLGLVRPAGHARRPGDPLGVRSRDRGRDRPRRDRGPVPPTRAARA